MADFDALKDWAQQSWKDQADWRESAEDDFAFIDGHQWSETEKAALEEQQRAAIVFNRTAVIIGSVAGSEINNRTEVRFIPREIGDVKPNEVLTAGGEWFRDLSDAEDADSEAFEDLLVCGLGVTDTSLDWEADPEGLPVVDKKDPLRFFWDTSDHTKGLIASRFKGYVHEFPSSEAEARFPGKETADIHCDWLRTSASTDMDHDEVGDEYRGEDDFEDDSRDTVTVVEIQWREREKVVEYIGPDGKKAEMPKANWDAIQKKAPMQMPNRVRTSWVWYRAYLGKDGILEQSQPDPEGCTFNVMTGKWDRKDKRFYGLLRSMRDPQKFANKWLSQTLHIINSNAKGGVMAEMGAVDDPREFEESWAAADGVTWLKDGAMAAGRIQEKPKVQMPQALMALTEFAISAIRDTSGVNLELLGLRDANQPGVLEYQRRQSAMTTMARFFDALRYYRKRQGHTILHFLTRHIAPTGRLVRIVKEDLVQYVPLAVDDGTKKYDIIVDDAPSAPNEKEKAWSVIEAMMPMLQTAGLSLDDWANILDYSPLPSSFSDMVREKAKAAKDAPPDMQQQLAEAEVMLKQAQAQKAGAEAQAKGGEAQMKQAEQAAKMGEIQAKQQSTVLQASVDQQQAAADLQGMALDRQMKLEEMSHQREQWAHEERMAAIQMQMAEHKAKEAAKPKPASADR